MVDTNAYWRGEHLSLLRDRHLGLRAAIAIDDTTLGPALGGVRYATYPSLDAGIVEAQRLAGAMTLKNALAGIPYGGGKCVVFNDGPVSDRAQFFTRFGEFVARLGGAYLPGVDMGTTTQDLMSIAAGGADVSCDHEDPSPWTALGVVHAIRSAVQFTMGQSDLSGLDVLIQGAGHVGQHVARRVAELGAAVLVTDIDGQRAQSVAGQVYGRVIDPGAVLDTPTDVFVPCAKAKVIDGAAAQLLRARIVAGAANDTLVDDTLAERLAERDILYVPDFVANAGGVIHIHGLRAGWDRARLSAEIAHIGDRVTDLLAASGTTRTPLAVARSRADQILSLSRAA